MTLEERLLTEEGLKVLSAVATITDRAGQKKALEVVTRVAEAVGGEKVPIGITALMFCFFQILRDVGYEEKVKEGGEIADAFRKSEGPEHN